MKTIFFIFIYAVHLYSLDFKVASYNVENFFDLHYDKTEYKEFIPHTKTWNKHSFTNKLQNITKTIKDLDADILALQEIESQKVLNAIIKKNPQYKYFSFYKNKDSAIGLALLSKYKILSSKPIPVDKYNKFSRDILKVNLLVDTKPLIIYVNHWRSKRAAESKRIKYALALKSEIDKQRDKDYIILGDLNSNYNEYKSFKYDKKLNNTFGITGINQILNTTMKENFVQKNKILTYKENVHFNTWLELKKNKRFSSKFRNEINTPDNILLSSALFDTKNISYINNSFNVFTPTYLFRKNRIFRWNQHKRIGYSDHLPIYARFSTTIQNFDFPDNTHLLVNKKNMISHLYDVEQVTNYQLTNVTVIYKEKNIAIVKQTNNDKAIMIYKPSDELKLGFNYNFTVNEIDEYNGLKEIKKISNISLNHRNNNFKDLYLDGNIINLTDERFLNNIVYNIQGVYKKRYLYFDNKKIRLYFKKEIKKPEEGEQISISSGHLSIYKSSMQIILHRDMDFRTF